MGSGRCIETVGDSCEQLVPFGLLAECRGHHRDLLLERCQVVVRPRWYTHRRSNGGQRGVPIGVTGALDIEDQIRLERRDLLERRLLRPDDLRWCVVEPGRPRTDAVAAEGEPVARTDR